MQDNVSILEGRSEAEKSAYLAAIASIATADRVATQEEQDRLTALIDAAGLSDQGRLVVQNAAADESGTELSRCLDTLKSSELKFSLVADLMAFAKADNDYNEQEQHSIQKVASYLGIDQQQFQALDQFAEKATVANVPADQLANPSFLESSGIGDKLKSLGINSSGLFKGLLAVAAPMLLSRIFGQRGPAGQAGGMGGGMMGGLSGGLGSLIGMLAGGRGLGNSGGLLGRMLGGAF